MGYDRALAVVSFGTSHRDAREAIGKTEGAIAKSLPGYALFRAFTSGMVIRKIAREENITIPNPETLLEDLARRGFSEVVVQSLHIIAGEEYGKLCEQTEKSRARFAKLTIGKPLLFEQADYRDCCRALLTHMPKIAEDEAFVFMGHGSDHPMNAAYPQLENMFRSEGYERVYVGTVEGFPDFTYIENRLARTAVKKVYIMPLMVTAGEHAKNDMAGDNKDSWKSRLISAGYETEVIMRGMGEFPEIAEIFARHAAV